MIRNTETVAYDYVEASFEWKGQSFEVTGGVVHNAIIEDEGIGSYEFQGMRGDDKRLVARCEYEKAEFNNISVYWQGDDQPLNYVEVELLEEAQLALFNKTYEQAEEEVMEAV